jgi:hypothetical protein
MHRGHQDRSGRICRERLTPPHMLQIAVDCARDMGAWMC